MTHTLPVASALPFGADEVDGHLTARSPAVTPQCREFGLRPPSDGLGATPMEVKCSEPGARVGSATALKRPCRRPLTTLA